MDAATTQAYAAIVQACCAAILGAATAYFAYTANRLLKFQTETHVDPSVTFSLYALPWVVHVDEPLNYVRIENLSPIHLNMVTLSAEIFGNKAGYATEEMPAIRHMGRLPDIEATAAQMWCIDQFVNEAVDLLKIGPNESSVKIRLHLNYHRQADGTAFHKTLLIRVLKKPSLRPLAVYADYRAGLLNTPPA